MFYVDLKKGVNMEIKFTNYISVKDYNEFRKSAGWGELNERQAETGLKNSTYLVVALQNDIPVGMGRTITDGGYIVYIADAIVLPAF